MKDLSQFDARRIIHTVGSSGQPPLWGAAYFTDGFQDTLRLLDEEFFSDYLDMGGSAFKLIAGNYGGGKTHFLYLLQELAWRKGYVVSYVSLTPEETPFHRLDLVYRAIAKGAACMPEGRNLHRGLMPVFKTAVSRWRAQVGPERREAAESLAADSARDLESMGVQRAIRRILKALFVGDEDTAQKLTSWLSAEGYDRHQHREYGILAPIDRSNAFATLRCLAQWVRQAGFKGLVILFDEAERMPSMSGRQKELMLSNLRELIDETARGTLPGAFVAYAIPDLRFFDGKTGVYEALKQRTATLFDFHNPSGVTIRLEGLVKDPAPHLAAIGRRLRRVYEIAYDTSLPDAATERLIPIMAEAVEAVRFADVSYRRIFVQAIVRTFEELRRAPDTLRDKAWATKVVDGFLQGGN